MSRGKVHILHHCEQSYQQQFPHSTILYDQKSIDFSIRSLLALQRVIHAFTRAPDNEL